MFLSRTLKVALAGVCWLYLPIARPALAQAWLPLRGEGNITVTYQSTLARGHLLGTGKRASGANAYDPVRAHTMTSEVEFGLTNKVALNLAFPVVAARYGGGAPHLIGVSGGPTDIDDGTYHGGVQDLRLGVRYKLTSGPLVVTPFAEGIIPSRHYESRGHAVIGLDLRALVVGTNLGGFVDALGPGMYYQVQLSHAVVQKVAGLRPNRSRLDLELGYFVTPRLALRFLESLQITHDGIDFQQPGQTREVSLNHDRLHRYKFLNLGGGLVFALNDSLQLFAAGGKLVWGKNVHPHYGLGVGVNWNFRTAHAVAPSSPNRAITSSALQSPVALSSLLP